MQPDPAEAIQRDIDAVNRISAVSSLLRVICDFTGLGFAAVARVTDQSWTACAVQDNIGFGLKAGGQLELRTTLCYESRLARKPVVIDHASEDPVYRDHHTPRIYGLESYISVPIMRQDGAYFGNLCAIDPKPAHVSDARTLAMFQLFAELISLQLESEDRYTDNVTALGNERATSELREQFIAVLGHDLRNPLAAAGVMAEQMLRTPEKVDVAATGQRLRAVVRRMAGLIDDVLDFARGRLGAGLGIAVAPAAALAKALANVVEELRVAHPGREIVETIVIGESVWCDQKRLQQLLSNLLGNALTYGAADQPIGVDAHIEAGELIVQVSNRGEPIPPASLGKVFEPYWRPAHGGPEGGLGLGLYICAQIVKAHGGTLEATSSAEDGTRFRVTLPLKGPA